MRRARQILLPFALLLASGLLMGACGGDDAEGGPPVIDPLSDKGAEVDSEFTLEITATDPDGDPIKFGFASDIDNIGTRADLRTAGNKAVFRWTPIAADIGLHAFDFTASDGNGTDRETITIDVRPAASSSNAPVFRKPLGTGTTLDLTQKKCLDVEIVVEDSDSPGVTITQGDPVIAGATLDQDSGLTGSWSWCPSKEQIAENDRYVIKLAADDGDNPTTIKNYLIVLRRAFQPGCAGEGPVISHTSPGDVSTIDPIIIEAHVTDDIAIKYEPLLYYSTKTPAEPPDLAEMNQLTMEQVSGDMKDGMWSVAIPNPVATQPTGSSATLHYLIVAQDDDDAAGDCDHLSQSPATGTHSMKVTNPNGVGPVTCTDDSWEPNDTLAEASVLAGLPPGETSGLVSCPSPTSGADEDWYPVDLFAGEGTITASLDGGNTTDLDLALVDGQGNVLALSDSLSSSEILEACVPTGTYYLRVFSWEGGENPYSLSYVFDLGSCQTQTCDDDSNENDDNATQARSVDLNTPPYKSDTNAICAGDEDWFEVLMFQGETLRATLTFDQATPAEDLDLILYKGSTNLTPCDEEQFLGCDVNNGQSANSNETLNWSITESDTYYVVVRGFGNSENLYDICLGFDDVDCPAP